MELRGKNVILVGASSGFGRALALELGRAGARLFLVARRRDLLESLAAELRSAGGEAHLEAADTADLEAVKTAFARFAAIAPPDGLIFNAGISDATLLGEFSTADVRRVLEVNFFGFLHWLEPFLPLARARRAGFIAATTALCAYRGIPSGEAYAASKGALGNFVEGLRLDLEPHGIQVFQLMPGLVESPMFDQNNVNSPLLISAAEGARHAVRGLVRDRSRIEFGPAMSRVYRLFRNMPDSWYSAVFRTAFVLPRAGLEQMVAKLPPFLCPEHGVAMPFDRFSAWVCPACGHRLKLERDHMDLADARSGEGHAPPAVSPLLTRLAMGWVWRGSFAKLSTFFRDKVADAARSGRVVLDVAPGGFGATLLKGLTLQPPLLAVGPSRSALLTAKGQLRAYPAKLFVVQEVEALRVPAASFSDVLCFGGLQAWSDPLGALRHLRTLLAPGGCVSGSYLLQPGTTRGDGFAQWCVRKGWLTSAWSEGELDDLFRRAGFHYEKRELNGRMLLFQVTAAT